MKNTLMNYIKLLRIKHYIKNFLIFSALLFSGQIFIKEKFISAIIAFISFSLISSMVYIFNDLKDIEKDKRHPTKKNRPLASGKISVKSAKKTFILLFGLSLVFNMCIYNIYSTVILLVYLIMNILYTLKLKDVPIVDITIIALGFLLRVVYGSIITNIEISNWLYLTVMSISYFFALGKRRNEIILNKNKNLNTRNVLFKYNQNFLDKNMYVCLTLSNCFYSLWSIEGTNNNLLVITSPIIFLITMKYSLDIEGIFDGDPVEVLFQDKILLFLCFIYAVSVILIMYLL